MTGDRDRRLAGLFEAALDLPRGERRAFLERSCPGDPGLRAEVLDLLARQGDGGDFLEPPRVVARPGAPPPGPDGPGFDPVPEVLGPYRLKEVIAEGGMGTVYRAEQIEPVQRPVALKLVKFGMDTRRLLARFRAEMQTLALMDHPHVTRMFDAGSTPSGRPYFVMEYFPGRAVTRFADEERMSVRDRLKLFLQACEAVHSAHQKGVIHRDLKPSNLLVMRVEGRPFLKVIDFGIAKLLEEDEPGATQLTRYGEIIGTPDYMSPEQLGEIPGGCDTTSDVYSLGVVLYELLTGSLPHEPPTSRLVGDPESGSRDTEAQRPSDRVASDPAVSRRISGARMTDPEGLRRTLRRDLDWIALKATAPEHSRRYQSVHELGADIERFLDGETVLAVAPSAAYRAQKFLRRYRALVIGAATVLVTLLAGIATTTWFAVQANRERTRQVQATREANRVAKKAERRAYTASLVAANAAFEDGDMSGVGKYLDRAPESLRGWEWSYLHSRVDDSIVRFTLPEGYRMRSWDAVAILPGDRRVAAVAGSTGTGSYFEWELDTGELLRRRDFVADRRGMCLSPDGTWLARVANGRYVVERAATGEPRPVDLGSVGPQLRPWRFTGNDDRLYFYSTGTEVQERTGALVDLRSGRGLPFLADFIGGSPSGDRLAFLTPDGVEIRSGRTGALIRNLRPLGEAVSNLAWLPSGDGVVTVDLAGGLHRRLVSGAPGGWSTVQVSKASLFAVAIDDSGEILTGGAGRAVAIVDARTGEIRAELHGHRDAIREITVCRTRPLAVSRSESEILAWNLADAGREQGVLQGHTSYVYPVAFTGNAGHLASGGWDGRIILWDAAGADPGPVREWRFPDPKFSAVEAMAADPGRDELVAVVNRLERPRLLVRLDLRLGVPDTLALPPIRSYADLALDPTRHRVAVVWFIYNGPSGFMVWDLDRMALIHQEQAPSNLPFDHAYCLAYAPDGRLAVTLGDGRLRILDGEAFAPLDSVDLGGIHLSKLAWSPDGARLAMARNDGAIDILDGTTMESLAQLTGHSGSVYGLAWSPDGTRLISGGEDRLLRIWSPDTGDELLRLRGHTSYVYGVAMSPDGTKIASGSGDGTVRLWTARETARGVAGG